MSALLAIVERATAANVLLVEEYLARAEVGDAGESTAAPPAAGGAPVAVLRAAGAACRPP